MLQMDERMINLENVTLRMVDYHTIYVLTHLHHLWSSLPVGSIFYLKSPTSLNAIEHRRVDDER